MNAILSSASMRIAREHATRRNDSRFITLPDMLAAQHDERTRSKPVIVSSRSLEFAASDPLDLDSDLMLTGPGGKGAKMTNYAFGQVCRQVSAPASYLATLPAPLAADALNFGYKIDSDVSDLGLLLTRDSKGADAITVRAANGPKYGRIWNCDVTRELVDRFGDGVTGQWKQPGIFGKPVEYSKENCTLFSGDRTMTVFLCDEENRIDVPNRRNGQSGSMARGFFVWNSEVGAATLGVGFFLFDYGCSNRIIWGMTEYVEKTLRHTVSAPDRWLEEVAPVLASYSQSAAGPVQASIAAAQSFKIEKAKEWLAARFTKKQAESMDRIHLLEEGRPVETIWDAVTAATAYARSIPFQDERTAIERTAGGFLKLAA